MNAAVEARLAPTRPSTGSTLLNAAGVPCGRVMGLGEVFADPQARDQEMVLSQEHPGHGIVKMLGFPIKFAEAPCRLRRPAPEIGGDTDAVLRRIRLFGRRDRGIAPRGNRLTGDAAGRPPLQKRTGLPRCGGRPSSEHG